MDGNYLNGTYLLKKYIMKVKQKIKHINSNKPYLMQADAKEKWDTEPKPNVIENQGAVVDIKLFIITVIA